MSTSASTPPAFAAAPAGVAALEPTGPAVHAEPAEPIVGWMYGVPLQQINTLSTNGVLVILLALH